MKNELLLFALAAGALLAPTFKVLRTARRAVVPVEGRSCELRPHCDKVLAHDWSPERHREVAALMRQYGHYTYADLHDDVAERVEVELRLEAERQVFARNRSAVRETWGTRVLT